LKQSQLFSKTSKNFPKDEEAVNAKYLIKGGFVAKNSSGVFSFLLLGWRVLNKINQIIREEMNVIGGQEILMPTLIAKKYWEGSGRWETDIMYKLSNSKSAESEEFGLGWTHEEVIADITNHLIQSEKDLPMAVYQIQTKFRREPRAKNGLLRCREFLMKDLYSFHASREDLENYYQTVIGAYKKIFDRMSLSYKITEASGGAFTKEYTHEFQVINPAGEDIIYCCDKCDFSQNKEIASLKADDQCPKCGDKISEANAIEVANVFKLGQRFSKWQMGSYGFGPSRAMGTLVEVFHDNQGIIWPDSVAPFRAHLLALSGAKDVDRIYQNFIKAGVEVLYDDRNVSAGEKFADADLLGIPHRLVVSEKTGDKIELKRRGLEEIKLITENELIKLLF
jgi:prolyl-tRNA synthetase